MFRRILEEWAEVFSTEQDEHLIFLSRGAKHDIMVPLMPKGVFFGSEMVFGEAVGWSSCGMLEMGEFLHEAAVFVGSNAGGKGGSRRQLANPDAAWFH